MNESMNEMTWGEVYRVAINKTIKTFFEKAPTKEDFLGTFEEHYEELIAEKRITSWPYSPPSSHRAAKSKAVAVWADDFSGRQ